MKTGESWPTMHLFLLSSNRRAATPHLVSAPARQRPALGACVAVLIAALAGCGGRSVGATETEEPRDAASGADVADCGATGNADASRMAACSLAYDPGPCNAFIPVFAFV